MGGDLLAISAIGLLAAAGVARRGSKSGQVVYRFVGSADWDPDVFTVTTSDESDAWTKYLDYIESGHYSPSDYRLYSIVSGGEELVFPPTRTLSGVHWHKAVGTRHQRAKLTRDSIITFVWQAEQRVAVVAVNAGPDAVERAWRATLQSGEWEHEGDGLDGMFQPDFVGLDVVFADLADDLRDVSFIDLTRPWPPDRKLAFTPDEGSPNVTTPQGYHRTAIAAKGASAPLRKLIVQRPGWVKGRVLDFGTGKGRDCKALGKRRGVEAACYDPHHPDPSIRKMPSGTFDLVVANYVVNVLPKAERKGVIKQMASKVARGGRLVVAARGCGDSGGRQTASSWRKHGDGHAVFDNGKLQRFQRFYSTDGLAREVGATLGRGFTRVELDTSSPDLAMVAFQRKA